MDAWDSVGALVGSPDVGLKNGRVWRDEHDRAVDCAMSARRPSTPITKLQRKLNGLHCRRLDPRKMLVSKKPRFRGKRGFFLPVHIYTYTDRARYPKTKLCVPAMPCMRVNVSHS